MNKIHGSNCYNPNGFVLLPSDQFFLAVAISAHVIWSTCTCITYQYWSTQNRYFWIFYQCISM